MKNSLQDRVRIVRIYNNIVQTEKCFGNVSDNYFKNIIKIFERLCHNISERYNSIFEHIEKIQITRSKSS